MVQNVNNQNQNQSQERYDVNATFGKLSRGLVVGDFTVYVAKDATTFTYHRNNQEMTGVSFSTVVGHPEQLDYPLETSTSLQGFTVWMNVAIYGVYTQKQANYLLSLLKKGTRLKSIVGQVTVDTYTDKSGHSAFNLRLAVPSPSAVHPYDNRNDNTNSNGNGNGNTNNNVSQSNNNNPFANNGNNANSNANNNGNNANSNANANNNNSVGDNGNQGNQNQQNNGNNQRANNDPFANSGDSIDISDDDLPF